MEPKPTRQKPKTVAEYLDIGCGRCKYGGTPQCKVHSWEKEIRQLRRIITECGLEEEIKWDCPCYTHQGKNIAMVAAFKDYAFISFFKGSLLQDEKRLLHKPGENSQASRLFKFTNPDQIIQTESTIKAYIYEAVEVEKAGLEVVFKKNPEPMPEELEQKLSENAKLKEAFEALTPGRQRGYILHFSQPKQSQTRVSRIEKCIPKIMEGKGFHDR
ncbi:MAG: YdeI/OmpD-associated family protein [Cyclobacteriaceae bacterium]